jgi:hypothetical protein
VHAVLGQVVLDDRRKRAQAHVQRDVNPADAGRRQLRQHGGREVQPRRRCRHCTRFGGVNRLVTLAVAFVWRSVAAGGVGPDVWRQRRLADVAQQVDRRYWRPRAHEPFAALRPSTQLQLGL